MEHDQRRKRPSVSDVASHYETEYRRAAGAVFRRLREEHGWSLRAFGEQTSTSHTTLFAVEQGRATPGIEVLGRVADAVGLDLPTLLLLIADELTPERGSLAQLLARISALTQSQRQELSTFLNFIQFRDAGGEMPA
jgi:transcriptional regulator with XRE-family HTH domain